MVKEGHWPLSSHWDPRDSYREGDRNVETCSENNLERQDIKVVSSRFWS